MTGHPYNDPPNGEIGPGAAFCVIDEDVTIDTWYQGSRLGMADDVEFGGPLVSAVPPTEQARLDRLRSRRRRAWGEYEQLQWVREGKRGPDRPDLDATFVAETRRRDLRAAYGRDARRRLRAELDSAAAAAQAQQERENAAIDDTFGPGASPLERRRQKRALSLPPGHPDRERVFRERGFLVDPMSGQPLGVEDIR